jgi:hypothetical protein
VLIGSRFQDAAANYSRPDNLTQVQTFENARKIGTFAQVGEMPDVRYSVASDS